MEGGWSAATPTHFFTHQKMMWFIWLCVGVVVAGSVIGANATASPSSSASSLRADRETGAQKIAVAHPDLDFGTVPGSLPFLSDVRTEEGREMISALERGHAHGWIPVDDRVRYYIGADPLESKNVWWDFRDAVPWTHWGGEKRRGNKYSPAPASVVAQWGRQLGVVHRRGRGTTGGGVREDDISLWTLGEVGALRVATSFVATPNDTVMSEWCLGVLETAFYSAGSPDETCLLVALKDYLGGDGVVPGVLTKVRWAGPRSNTTPTLLPLNPLRHFEFVKQVPGWDTPWEKKKRSVVWRGATTWNSEDATADRMEIVKRFAGDTSGWVDVGFSIIANRVTKDIDMLKHVAAHEKSYLEPAEQLRHKYILVMEGEDVATSLKWILASQSVVFMPEPTRVSWFMEDCLVPFKHYIPILSNGADLRQKYEWAEAHPAECRSMAAHATTWVAQFFHPQREALIAKRVAEWYTARWGTPCFAKGGTGRRGHAVKCWLDPTKHVAHAVHGVNPRKRRGVALEHILHDIEEEQGSVRGDDGV